MTTLLGTKASVLSTSTGEHWWCNGQHCCLPSSRSGFDSRPMHSFFFFLFFYTFHKPVHVLNWFFRFGSAENLHIWWPWWRNRGNFNMHKSLIPLESSSSDSCWKYTNLQCKGLIILVAPIRLWIKVCTSRGPRPKTNPSTDHFQYTRRMRSADKTTFAQHHKMTQTDYTPSIIWPHSETF